MRESAGNDASALASRGEYCLHGPLDLSMKHGKLRPSGAGLEGLGDDT